MRTARFLLMVIALCACTMLQAQTDVVAKQQVEKIRKQYGEAKQMAAHSEKTGQDYYNDLEVKIRRMVAGTGMRYETIRYFFGNDFDEESELYIADVYFITRQYNVAARKYYEEYLFDPQSGQLIFAFLQESDTPAGQKNETRYYWGAEGLVHQIVKGTPLMDDVFTQRTASDLVAAFNLIENRIYE